MHLYRVQIECETPVMIHEQSRYSAARSALLQSGVLDVDWIDVTDTHYTKRYNTCFIDPQQNFQYEYSHIV